MCKRAETMQRARRFCIHSVAICILTSTQMAKAQSGGPHLITRSDISQPTVAVTAVTPMAKVAPRETLTMRPISADKQETHHTGRIIATGAVIGGALLGGVELNHARHCVDCFFTGTAVVAAIGVGAVGGAFLGWIASNIR